MQEHICFQDSDVLGCRCSHPRIPPRTSILRKKGRNFPSNSATPGLQNTIGVYRAYPVHHQDLLVHRAPGLDETHPYRKVSDSTDDGHTSSYDEDATHHVASIYEHQDKHTSIKSTKKKRCNPKQQSAWSGLAVEDPGASQNADFQVLQLNEAIWNEKCNPETVGAAIKLKKRDSKKKGKKPQKPTQSSQPSYMHKLKTEMCKNFALQGWCQWGDQCSYAHGDCELQSKKHLNSNYKRKICVNYHVHGYCAYGLRCQYYHVRDSYQDFLQSALEFISCRIGTVLEDQEPSGSKDLATTIRGCAHLTPRLPIFQQMAPDTKTTPSILEQYRCIQQ